MNFVTFIVIGAIIYTIFNAINVDNTEEEYIPDNTTITSEELLDMDCYELKGWINRHPESKMLDNAMDIWNNNEFMCDDRMNLND